MWGGNSSDDKCKVERAMITYQYSGEGLRKLILEG